MFNLAKNKKGVAEIITTLALIVIAIVSVAFAAHTILNAVAAKADIQSSPAYRCLDLQTANNPILEITKSCYNSETKETEITLKRTPYQDLYISSLKFMTGDSVWECSDSCTSQSINSCKVLEKGETKTYYFSNPENPGTTAVFLNDNCEIDAVNTIPC